MDGSWKVPDGNHRVEPYESDGEPRQIIYFASAFNGDMFGWNLFEVTESNGPEYAIYGLAYGEEEDTSLAGTFLDFIRLCMDWKPFCKLMNIRTYEGYKSDPEFAHNYSDIDVPGRPGVDPKRVFRPVSWDFLH